jgi:hypothetical protein
VKHGHRTADIDFVRRDLADLAQQPRKIGQPLVGCVGKQIELRVCRCQSREFVEERGIIFIAE